MTDAPRPSIAEQGDPGRGRGLPQGLVKARERQAFPPRQLQMSLMERAHSGNDPDRAFGICSLFSELTKGGDYSHSSGYPTEMI